MQNVYIKLGPKNTDKGCIFKRTVHNSLLNKKPIPHVKCPDSSWRPKAPRRDTSFLHLPSPLRLNVTYVRRDMKQYPLEIILYFFVYVLGIGFPNVSVRDATVVWRVTVSSGRETNKIYSINAFIFRLFTIQTVKEKYRLRDKVQVCCRFWWCYFWVEVVCLHLAWTLNNVKDVD